MGSRKADLVDAISRERVLAAKLRAIADGEEVTFQNVVDQAQPTLCAAIARATPRRVWIVCPNLRSQEYIHNELIQWFPEAHFFPELDVAPVEGAIADPEAVADRLSIVQRLAEPDGKKRAPIVVLARSSLGDSVVDEQELARLRFVLTRGTRFDRDELIKKLSAA